MSIRNERDVRAVLVREKYFTLRPKPLERWLWQRGLPQAAERVFWLHWEEGMRRGDWCSELSLKQVSRECCIDASTVTRAYQLLKGLELIRREDPGRDPANPFQQAIAITEVRLPRELVVTLGHAPNRPSRVSDGRQGPERASAPRGDIISPGAPSAAPAALALPATPSRKMTREESRSLMQKLSANEQREFFQASRDRRTSMVFDEATALEPEERGRVLELLAQISGERPKPADHPQSSMPRRNAMDFAGPRKLSALEAARLRRRILDLVPAAGGAEVFRQVLWSVEEGALRRFDARLAGNIALKKIREGAWTRPNRMPPNWLRAAPETCSAA
jgi:hypothetical protein